MLSELAPFIIAAFMIVNGWLLWRSSEGRKDRAEIWNEMDKQRTELASFKERVAREHVTFDVLAKVEERVVAAIERLGDRLDRLFEGKTR